MISPISCLQIITVCHTFEVYLEYLEGFDLYAHRELFMKSESFARPCAVKIDRDAILSNAKFADAYYIVVAEPGLDAPTAAQRMLGNRPAWVTALMHLRNWAAAMIGLKQVGSGRTPLDSETIGGFNVISSGGHRLVAGLDDWHLDFRLIIDVVNLEDCTRITTTTIVREHNIIGSVYLVLVLPFHRIIAPAMLRQVATKSVDRPSS